jgi:hypothetical protein
MGTDFIGPSCRKFFVIILKTEVFFGFEIFLIKKWFNPTRHGAIFKNTCKLKELQVASE